MLVPTEKRERGTYIGGRAITAIAGVDQYGSALNVYAEIVAKAKVEMNGFMLRGLIIEPGLADYVSQQRGVPLIRDAFYLDDANPHFGGSIDSVEGDPKRPQIMHEYKTTTSRNAYRWGPTGSDEVEESCYYQVQWYMGISGARECHVWCMIVDTGEMPRHYVVPRNEKVIGELRAVGNAFWNDHIIPGIPPAASRSANEAVNALYPHEDPGSIVEATDELIVAATAYAKARGEEKTAKGEKDSAAAVLKSLLGNGEKSTWIGGSTSWKSRALKPQTDWEEVAHQIAMKVGLEGEVFNGFVKEQTRARSTAARVLLVSIRGQTED